MTGRGVKRWAIVPTIFLVLSLTSLNVFGDESNPDIVIREAKAVVDDTGKIIETIKSLFTPPIISEEKFINDLREQRAVASRLFTRIRTVINKAEIAIQQLKFNISKLNQQLSDMTDELSEDDKGQINSTVTVAQEYFLQALAGANSRLNEALNQQKNMNEKLEEFRRSGIDVDNEKTKWENAISVLSGRRPVTLEMRNSAIQALGTLNQQIKALLDKNRPTSGTITIAKREIATYQKVMNTYKVIFSHSQNLDTLNALTTALQNGENELDASIHKIDEKFVSKINDNRTKDFYTAATTAIFGLAVIIVIIYFFRLANNDAVRLALFQNDSGLQFVTLFSIVIAIILFGVLKILEGRELAALLGGLSGYILGRGSISRQGVQPGDGEAVGLGSVPTRPIGVAGGPAPSPPVAGPVAGR